MEQEKDMDADRKLPCGPEKDIGYYIKRINDKLKAGFDAYLCDVDLTSSQARVIEYVYWNGGMVTQKEIEVFLDVAHPTVVGIVNRLEKKGYLNCHLDENNKRNKMVCSTCEAEKLLNKMYEGRRAAEQRLLHSFSENEAAQVKKLLEKLYENIR